MLARSGFASDLLAGLPSVSTNPAVVGYYLSARWFIGPASKQYNVVPMEAGIQRRSKHTGLLAGDRFRIKPGMTGFLVFSGWIDS